PRMSYALTLVAPWLRRCFLGLYTGRKHGRTDSGRALLVQRIERVEVGVMEEELDLHDAALEFVDAARILPRSREIDSIADQFHGLGRSESRHFPALLVQDHDLDVAAGRRGHVQGQT